MRKRRKESSFIKRFVEPINEILAEQGLKADVVWQAKIHPFDLEQNAKVKTSLLRKSMIFLPSGSYWTAVLNVKKQIAGRLILL